ncbi:MAG: hypothetical protein FWC26_14210, partial [Fibromonadales bacterium]|nr:hypothetical protein [Fibromonadales bacterium]
PQQKFKKTLYSTILLSEPEFTEFSGLPEYSQLHCFCRNPDFQDFRIYRIASHCDEKSGKSEHRGYVPVAQQTLIDVQTIISTKFAPSGANLPYSVFPGILAGKQNREM